MCSNLPPTPSHDYQASTTTFRFREHRGSLAEAMKTVREFTSVTRLLMYLEELYGDIHSLEFQYACFDERIGWDTYYVVANGSCVGMTDRDPNRPRSLMNGACADLYAIKQRVDALWIAMGEAEGFNPAEELKELGIKVEE